MSVGALLIIKHLSYPIQGWSKDSFGLQIFDSRIFLGRKIWQVVFWWFDLRPTYPSHFALVFLSGDFFWVLFEPLGTFLDLDFWPPSNIPVTWNLECPPPQLPRGTCCIGTRVKYKIVGLKQELICQFTTVIKWTPEFSSCSLPEIGKGTMGIFV